MATAESTCWTLIDAAGQGHAHERDEFARRYEEPVRAYLKARWRNSTCFQYLDDAVQNVFLLCYAHEGPLYRVERSRQGGFRPYFYGIIRNVARSFERRGRTEQRRSHAKEVDIEQLTSDESSFSVIYDRAWAKSVMQEAARRQLEQARKIDDAAERRVELLRLRFHDGLPIREIAQRWNVEPAKLHRQYAKAQDEFRVALLEVVSFNNPGSSAEVDRECAELLDLLN